MEIRTDIELPASVLVVGVDASGKSTFLSSLAEQCGYFVVEPTATPRAKVYKHQTAASLISQQLVDEREAIYLELNQQFAIRLNESRSQTRLATTGDSLVTRLSHAVMRRVAGIDSDVLPAKCTEIWLDSNGSKPEAIVLTHAPFETIWDRLTQRQAAGAQHEEFWGFNAPFYLRAYQEEWKVAINAIRTMSDIKCFEFNTALQSPEAIMQQFTDG